MKNARIVTIHFPTSRPDADFDAIPNVSAIIGDDDSGMPMLGRFSSTVELSREEYHKALEMVFDEYVRNGVPAPKYLEPVITMSDDEFLNWERSIHRCT